MGLLAVYTFKLKYFTHTYFILNFRQNVNFEGCTITERVTVKKSKFCFCRNLQHFLANKMYNFVLNVQRTEYSFK